MLHQGSKLIIILISILFLFSCNKYKRYDQKEIAEIRERVLVKSQSILGKEEYYTIYQMASDSITNWIKHDLDFWKYFGNLTDYQLDSVFCINETGDKIFFAILKRNMINKAVGDGISLKDLEWYYSESGIKKMYIHHYLLKN